MALVLTRSALNPNAPLFIPAAFRQVEDFSPEWWQLVTTSAWYHDYWLSQHQGEDGFYDNSEDDFGGDDIADLLPDTIDLWSAENFLNMESQLEEFVQFSGIEPLPTNVNTKKDAEAMKNVNFLKSVEESDVRSSYAPAKYAEKAFKPMSPKCSSKRIQQPR